MPTYKFAVRVLIADWEGCEVWATIFDQTAVKFLGFSANAYVSMTSETDRYAALSLLRGTSVRATIKKRVTPAYVNYTVSELEVAAA